MALLAAFQLLLSRWAGNDDVVIGTPVAGRERRETEGLIGFFVNTLAVRTDLSGDPSFREVLRRVRAATVGALEHQALPFERLVAELQPDRTAGHSPIFQVMFLAEDGGTATGDAGGLAGRELAVERDAVQFDLTLELDASARGVRGTLAYSTELFEPETAERMLRHYGRVLEQVAEDPDRRLSTIDLMDADERRRVTEAWQGPALPFPRDVCLHTLVEAQARARPNAPALAWDAEVLTYGELDARADRLAQRLVRRGVGPEDRVGVLLERGADLVVAILAVLKAGGCYVPLDPAYPPERLRWMMTDAGIRTVVSRGEVDIPMEHADVVLLDADPVPDGSGAGPPPRPRRSPVAENLAYVFYTSGSTGRPKGVMVSHREVVQLVSVLPYLRMGPGDRVAQASSTSFDAAVFEIWAALANGATLVGIPRDVLLSTPALARTLRSERITFLYQTAGQLGHHVREQADVYASLHQLVFGAEAAGTEGVRRLLRDGRPANVLHVYGPTETTVWCTTEPVDALAEDALSVPIGRPVPNARAAVVDASLLPLPPGLPGELCVGGACVARGYLGRPALTAERFVPDAHGPPGARMYRTGDRVRWKADGRVEFLGRLDAQVKLRGMRVEPGEVEAALEACPGIRQARAVVREDAPGDRRLVAYVVQDGESDAEEWRARLRRTLPEHMIPAAFVSLDALPLTANGKLDVRMLPVPAYAGTADRYAAPRTPAEELLAEIWCEVLGVERVGREDGFFE
ncbi:MAG TPA: amino acid adenylation domain-containing protein, partial [Longimicrobium sp.]|nr:amino acid adenylation domain-containing protein [Longimicrobium sp.]